MMLNSLRKPAGFIRRYLGIAGICSLYHPLAVLADGMFTDMAAPYESCGYCHEYDGNPSMEKYPKLGGQKQAYIIKQLQDYRDGKRDGKGMMDTASTLLSDQDIQTVAEFFSRQKPGVTAAEPSAGNFPQARELWEHGSKERMIVACTLCHTAADPEIPYLSGQHAEYLAEQLRAFKQKARTNDVATIMQFLAERLSDQEIVQLSQFIATGAQQ
ncbi:MAG: cytochrome c4 [Gammaproteobacteria bacterium]|nr:cytochrome c4 [Gammaproteobacteria bacterium]